MNKFIEGLNKEQKESVLYFGGPLAIIAGAGSGKTKTIIHKIAYLLDEKNIKPSRIMAVTFTNKASNEMEERLIDMVGEDANKIQLSTYHSLGAKIIRTECEKLGIKKSFNILDNKDQEQILNPIYKKYNLTRKLLSYSNALSYISKNKTLFISPEKLIKESKKDNDKVIAKIYRDYNKKLEEIQSLDFNDLLIKTKILFDKYPEVAKKWSNKFDYILVDEFQDTSLLQYDIIKLISKNDNITIVGDPDQTIYSWRQADVNLINNFKKYFKRAKIIKLIQNYRSKKIILDKANKLISHNSNRFHKDLITSNNDKGHFEFYHAKSEQSEARWIVEQINTLRKNRHQLKDIAILYRANYLSATIEKALINANINYVIFGGYKFFQREEVKDVISYLKILMNNDEFAFRRVINTPARSIGNVALSKLDSFAESFNETLFQSIVTNFNDLPSTPTVKENLKIFILLIKKYQKALETNSIYLVITNFLKEVNYLSIWNTITETSRIENVNELTNSIEEWEKNNPKSGLSKYLEEISLYTEKHDHSFALDYVSLMTVHSAKGLEYENVFIAGFSEGVFPSFRTLNEFGNKGLEEERRLAYVAITRAKTNLFISDARGFSNDHKSQKRPSKFLVEMEVNIRAFTKEFIAPKSTKENYTEKNKHLAVGDLVSHVKFGNGTIVAINNDVAEVAFKDPHGVKSLMKNHKSLERLD